MSGVEKKIKKNLEPSDNNESMVKTIVSVMQKYAEEDSYVRLVGRAGQASPQLVEQARARVARCVDVHARTCCARSERASTRSAIA